MRLLLFLALFSCPWPTSAATQPWNFNILGHITRCFETKKTHFHCEIFEGYDRVVRREMQIEAIDDYDRHFHYIYGRAIEGSLCQGHFKKIKKLLAGTNQVCVTGDREFETTDKDKEVIVRWVSLETRRGEVLR